MSEKTITEKRCERCLGLIRHGEGYAETDIGSGKWVHWPSCPPSARVIPEKEATKEEFPWPNMQPDAIVEEKELPTFTPALLGLVKKAWESRESQRFWEWIIQPVENGVLVGLRGVSRPHELFPVGVIEKIGSHHSGPEKSMEEIFIVDGLTLKDYYDLRDLRLLLWGLEKELIGKHGIIEAEPLASKVRELIKEKISQVESKIGSSPEHHSSPVEQDIKAKIARIYHELEVRQREIVFGPGTEKEADEKRKQALGYIMEALGKILKENPSSSEHHSSPEHHVTREEAEAEINVLIDNLTIAIRKGGEIPPDLREALRRNFMFFKENPHPLVSAGKFDVKYIDSATGKTVEKTILAREQFDLYKQQREGKISIISVHPSASTGNPDGKDHIQRPPF